MQTDLPSNRGLERYLGKFEKAWAVKGACRWLTEYTASGGFVTAFLAFLLETGRADGVINVGLGAGGVRAACGQLITRAADLPSSAGSVYYPVSLGAALKQAAREGGSYAVVGLPCEVRGLRRWQHLGTGNLEFPIVLSLFCGFVPGAHAFEYALRLMGVDPCEWVDRLAFRARRGSRDGLLAVSGADEFFMPRSEFTSLLNRLFSSNRCLVCSDMTGQKADISCGDARSELGENKTLVLSRSLDATGCIVAAAEAGYLCLSNPVSATAVFSTQSRVLRYKKETIAPRLRIARVLNGAIPEGSSTALESFVASRRQRLGATLFYLVCTLTRMRLVYRNILPHLPSRALHRLGAFIYGLLTCSVEDEDAQPP